MKTPSALLEQFGPRDQMDVDVLIVGGGPAGLSAAIRLRQLAQQAGQELQVVVLEKGSEAGAHILSGAVMDPRALEELFPDWKERGAPLHQAVTADDVLFLTETEAHRTPDSLIPKCFDNHGNYVVQLGAFTKWLAEQAEALGVEIYAGFAAAEILYGPNNEVLGAATGHMGLDKSGQATAEFALGMELRAKYTLFAEGSRGHLGKQLVEKFKLDAGKDPQAYALGIKELWEIQPSVAKPGHVVHTTGWPHDVQTYGGGFLYHLQGNLVTLGLVTGLDYANPWISPFEEMQRWKTHPAIRQVLEGGRRIGYGARAITAGGLLSLPKLTFPGGALIGCDAGFLDASRIKGSHAAIKSGSMAADACFDAIQAGRQGDELLSYAERFEASWLFDELHAARNFKSWFKKGRYIGMLMTGIERWLLPKLGFKTPPWTLHREKADHLCLEPAAQHAPIAYPKPDGQITFDRLSSVFISNAHHTENQPAHLTLKDPNLPVATNLSLYAGPEQRYCPAGVYEFVRDEDQKDRLQINAANCVHCKTCDIKDPRQNIVWVTPEGGGGPNYAGM